MMVLGLTFVSTARADNQQSINGLVLGAGGGALVGQAIGRNTESTVIGSALGGVVGYIIGSEMDRDTYRYRSHRPRFEQPPRVPVHRKKVVVQNNYYYDEQPGRATYGQCREAEVLGTIRGKARKMYATVCKTERGWEILPDEQAYYEDTRHTKNWKRKSHEQRRPPSKKVFRQRWVRHYNY
jgi:hypothetical protein